MTVPPYPVDTWSTDVDDFYFIFELKFCSLILFLEKRIDFRKFNSNRFWLLFWDCIHLLILFSLKVYEMISLAHILFWRAGTPWLTWPWLSFSWHCLHLRGSDGLLRKYWSYILAGFCLLWIFYNNFSENNEFKISINSCHFWSVAKFCRCRRWRRRSCFVGQERSSTFSWKTCKRKLIIPIFLNKKDIVILYKNCCGNSKIQKKKFLFWQKGNHSVIRDISYTLC